MPETAWVQLDDVHTETQHQINPWIVSGGMIQHDHDSLNPPPHEGTISEGEWETAVRDPAVDQTVSNDVIEATTRRVSYITSKKWLTVSKPGGIPGQLLWATSLQVWGSTASVLDWQPLSWMSETAIAVRDAFLADNPTATSAYVEWETNPFTVQPWGSTTNRELTFTIDSQRTKERDRDGVEVLDSLESGPANFEHDIIAMLRSEPETIETQGYGYDPDEGWWVSALELYPFLNVSSLHDLNNPAVAEVLTSPFTDTVTVPISDEMWADNSYLITQNGGGYTTRGLPLAIGPTGTLSPGIFTTPADEDKDWTPYGTLFFETDWTPPRYKIVYSEAETLPALRLYPRDGDGRGLGGATRLYPPARGTRLYPPHA